MSKNQKDKYNVQSTLTLYDIFDDSYKNTMDNDALFIKKTLFVPAKKAKNVSD